MGSIDSGILKHFFFFFHSISPLSFFLHFKSDQLKEADSDVRAQFPALFLRNALCPFPNCSFTCSPRHSVDFLNHVLSLHVQYKRFSCDVCTVSVATATQLRRHFREYHKLEKSELKTKMDAITEIVEKDLASLRSTQMQGSHGFFIVSILP